MAIQYEKNRVLLLLVIAVGLLVAAVLFFFHQNRSQEQVNEPAPQLNNEVLVFPDSSLLSSIKTQTAELQPSYRNDVIPGDVVPIAGKALPVFLPFPAQVVSINALVGEDVEAGQAIAQLRSPTIALYWGEWLKANSGVEMAQKDYQRAQSLMASGAKSKKELQISEMLYMQAKAEQLRTRSQLLAVGISEDELSSGSTDQMSGTLTIRAPFKGKIGNITAGIGQNLSDLSVPFMTVTPDGANWIKAQVPQSIADRISTENAPFASVEGSFCKGSLINADPAVDPLSRRRSFYLECEDPHLHVGDYVTVNLKSQKQNALLIPKSALVMNNNDVLVFTENEPLKFTRHKVDIIYDEKNSVQVSSGINPGDHVVTSGAVVINSYYPQ